MTLTAPCQPFEHPGNGGAMEDHRQSPSHQTLPNNHGKTSEAGADGHIRVLLADDHPTLRAGLARMLADQNDIEVVGEAADGQEAVELAEQLNPDVIIMDIVMPRLNGLEATARITSKLPHIQIIGLSMYSDPEVAQSMRNMGAAAYLGKGEPLEVLLEQIRTTARSAGTS